MSELKNHQLTWKRAGLDKGMHWLVTAGGATVLVLIVLIFLYLAWAVAPMFNSANIQPIADIATAERDALLVDMNETGDVALRVSSDGLAEFFAADSGALLAAYTLDRSIAHAQRVDPSLDTYALLDTEGQVWLVKAVYNVALENGERRVEPSLRFTFTNHPIPLGATDHFDVHWVDQELLIVRSHEESLTLLRYQEVLEGVALLDPRQVSIARSHDITHVAIGPRNKWLYLIDNTNSLQVIDIRNLETTDTLFRTQLLAPERSITAITSLVGRYSLIVGDDRGVVTQWFVVRDELGFRLQPVRNFTLDTPALTFIKEPRRKGFLAITSNGEGHLLYPAAEGVLASAPLNLKPHTPMNISARADFLITAPSPNRLRIVQLNNPHPEIATSTLVSQVWYEGYSAPVYSWQSSSADNDFEPKFSLAPLMFGTVKGAIYALLFAIPIAILGAIYTAYFMQPALRSWIKPGIEIMAALPTVILGIYRGAVVGALVRRAAFKLFNHSGWYAVSNYWHRYQLALGANALAPAKRGLARLTHYTCAYCSDYGRFCDWTMAGTVTIFR